MGLEACFEKVNVIVNYSEFKEVLILKEGRKGRETEREREREEVERLL